jgi:hypothetical protein
LLRESRQRIEDQAKMKAEAEAEARKPYWRLLSAYKGYIYVKYCNEVRQGYLSVYVNDVEFERARVAVKAIEKDALAEDNTMNTGTMWNDAILQVKGSYADQYRCQSSLNELLQQYARVHPPEYYRKDF